MNTDELHGSRQKQSKRRVALIWPFLFSTFFAVCTALTLHNSGRLREQGESPKPPNLWQEYTVGRGIHANIPNCSYSGFAFGEKSFPEPEIIINVKDYGASGDGVSDDTQAVKGALAKAQGYKSQTANGVCVFFPAGKYCLSDILQVSTSGISIRGDGADNSTIYFTKSLSDIKGFSKEWSWRGGLVWFEGGLEAGPAFPSFHIVGNYNEGERFVKVDNPNAAALSIGHTITMHWLGDIDLLSTIFGHESAKTIDWNSWRWIANGRFEWEWTNQIVSINDDVIELKKPVRIPIKESYNVIAGHRRGQMQLCSIESISIEMPEHPKAKHLNDLGFNAIFFSLVNHSMIRDVAIKNADNGVILERSSNNLISNLSIPSGQLHHATSFRYQSHDNITENFIFTCEVTHGISTQDLSSGNVWRNGTMQHGTFDTHRGMPFDSIRTNISLANCDGNCGGSDGPLLGRRMVNWNVTVEKERKRNASVIIAPEYYSMGALVNIKGMNTRSEPKPWCMPPGDKGTRVVSNDDTLPIDLYEAQLRFRLPRDHLPP